LWVALRAGHAASGILSGLSRENMGGRNGMKALRAASICGALLAPAALAAGPMFDAPLDTAKHVLPETKADAETTLSCLYYPHFMVKQVDEGEVGATQLSMIPVGDTAKPACRRENVAAEKIVNPRDWSGYFKGVKGGYVFFDADDGVDGGLGFAVFSADATKLFDDSAVGDIESATTDAAGLTLRYKRSFSGDCSVPHEGAKCWARIAAATGLDPAAQPDCAAGYRQAKAEMAKGRCEADGKPGPACLAAALKELDAQHWDDAPSVVVYPVETVLAQAHKSTKALGPPLSCHPSD